MQVYIPHRSAKTPSLNGWPSLSPLEHLIPVALNLFLSDCSTGTGLGRLETIAVGLAVCDAFVVWVSGPAAR